MKPPLPQARSAAALSLLLSSGTLVCCALPALLVLLGAGSVLATLLTWFPSLALLSRQKTLLFVMASLALLLAGAALARGSRLPCPSDPSQARRCRLRLQQARWLYGLSCALFSIGFLAAFVLPRLQPG